jgi:hypothetical protein
MQRDGQILFPTFHRLDGVAVHVEQHDDELILVVALGDERRTRVIDSRTAQLFWGSGHTEPHELVLAVEGMAGQMTERSP